MDRCYIITNGQEYLKYNFQVTKSLSLAGMWDSETVNDILENIKNSSKYIKYNFEVKFHDKNEFQNQQTDISSFFDINALIEKLTSLADISEKISQYNEFLNQQYEIIEREISDIRHCIEFSRLDACKGYKLCKLLQDKLIFRRQIKDEQLILEKLKEIRLLQFKEVEIHKAYDCLEMRKYKPRILQELFN